MFKHRQQTEPSILDPSNGGAKLGHTLCHLSDRLLTIESLALSHERTRTRTLTQSVLSCWGLRSTPGSRPPGR